MLNHIEKTLIKKFKTLDWDSQNILTIMMLLQSEERQKKAIQFLMKNKTPTFQQMLQKSLEIVEQTEPIEGEQ